MKSELSRDKKRIRVCVVGAVSVDIQPIVPDTKGSISFGDFIKPSEITHVDKMVITPGGPVANTGIAMHTFDLDPILIAKTGKDSFGSFLRSEFEDKIGSSSIAGLSESDTSDTAQSIIIAGESLDRAILQYPGANDDFKISDIDFSSLSDIELFHFGHPSTMKNMYQNTGKELTEIMKKAHSKKIMTSLDLCKIDPSSNAAKEDWIQILKNTLPYVDFFVPSIGDFDGIFSQEILSSPEEVIKKCSELGATNILLKSGKDGLYYKIEDESCEYSSGHFLAQKVPHEISGLGAGDVTVAAFLSAYLQGYSLETCLELAVAEGALCVQDATATATIKPFEEVQALSSE